MNVCCFRISVKKRVSISHRALLYPFFFEVIVYNWKNGLAPGSKSVFSHRWHWRQDYFFEILITGPFLGKLANSLKITNCNLCITPFTSSTPIPLTRGADLANLGFYWSKVVDIGYSCCNSLEFKSPFSVFGPLLCGLGVWHIVHGCIYILNNEFQIVNLLDSCVTACLSVTRGRTWLIRVWHCLLVAADELNAWRSSRDNCCQAVHLVLLLSFNCFRINILYLINK